MGNADNGFILNRGEDCEREDIVDKRNAIFILDTKLTPLARPADKYSKEFEIIYGEYVLIDVEKIYTSIIFTHNTEYREEISKLMKSVTRSLRIISDRYTDAVIASRNQAYKVRLLNAADITGHDIYVIKDLMLAMLGQYAVGERNIRCFNKIARYMHATYNYGRHEVVRIEDL